MKYTFFLLVFVFYSCIQKPDKETAPIPAETVASSQVTLYVLGTVQDGGSPHIGCQKECCADLFNTPDSRRKVVSLGVVDAEHGKSYLFEATPDISFQLKSLKTFAKAEMETPTGIFLTHAHMGHYTGLMYLGREALGAHKVPVYALPRMKAFLESNGPWEQLVALDNIDLQEIQFDHKVSLTTNLEVSAFQVPHRDEYSETAGYTIKGPNKTALFIPDIDKWSRWEKSIVDEIKKVDYAFLDATFFDGKEINNRDISEIPHPFAIESLALFKTLPPSEKEKIHFIHFNHTNPLLNSESEATKAVLDQGFKIASYHQRIPL